MKKNVLQLLVVLMLALSLSGCGCEHEWVEANCVTPKTCSLCQETEGEALGHEYDKWDVINDEKMSHACVNCDAAETREIDRETVLNDQIPGSWDSEYVRKEDNRLDFDGYRYTFYEDHTFVWSSNAGESVEGEWNYLDYVDGVSQGYIVELMSEVNGEEQVALLVAEDQYVIFELAQGEYETYYPRAENVEPVKEKIGDAPVGPRDDHFVICEIETFENSVDDTILYTAARLVGAKIPKGNVERQVSEDFISYNVSSKGTSLMHIAFVDSTGEFIWEEDARNEIALIYVAVEPEQRESTLTKLALICLMRECDGNLTPKEAEQILLDLQDGLELMAEGRMQTDGSIIGVQKNDVRYWVDASDEAFFAISKNPLGDIL